MKAWVLLLSGACLTASALAQGKEPPSQAEAVQIAQMTNIIGSCLRKHWRLSAKVQPVRVTIRWELLRNGRLAGPPKVVGQEVTPEITPSAKAAIQAIRECQPFKLPAARYHVWKDIVWDFDPTSEP